MEERRITEKQEEKSAPQVTRPNRVDGINGNCVILLGLTLAALAGLCGAIQWATGLVWMLHASLAVLILWNVAMLYVLHRQTGKGEAQDNASRILVGIWDCTCGTGAAYAAAMLFLCLKSPDNLPAGCWSAPVVEAVLLLVGCMISRLVMGQKVGPMACMPAAMLPVLALIVQGDDDVLATTAGAMVLLALITACSMTILGVGLNDRRGRQETRR